MGKGNNLLSKDLSELSTQQLDDLLAEELRKDVPNENTIKQILAILREHDNDLTEKITPQIQQAWENYKKASAEVVSENPKFLSTRFIRAASLVLVLLSLFTLLPNSAQAEPVWHRLARWTDSLFEFFDPYVKDAPQSSYIYKTDHSGLQKIYDKVVETGIVEPVVPMWVPTAYKLQEYEIAETVGCFSIIGRFTSDKKDMFLAIRRYDSIVSGQYEKDETEIIIIEVNGITHYIMRNKDRWNVAWTQNNLECFLSIDCQESDLYRIIKSIYTSEEKQ